MVERSNRYSEREREAAILAIAVPVAKAAQSHDEVGAIVDAAFKAIGMRRLEQPFQPMNTAPRDRDVILRLPKGQEVRAVWWGGWVDLGDPNPWAWREARADGTVGEPIEEADGWREL